MSLTPFWLFWIAVGLSLTLAFFLFPDLGLPDRSELKTWRGVVAAPPSGAEGVDFSLSGEGRIRPFHYDYRCGAGPEAAKALEHARKAERVVEAAFRPQLGYFKPRGFAYQTFAVSIPGVFERTFAQCQLSWVANNRLTALALSPFAVYALYMLLRILRSFRRRESDAS